MGSVFLHRAQYFGFIEALDYNRDYGLVNNTIIIVHSDVFTLLKPYLQTIFGENTEFIEYQKELAKIDGGIYARVEFDTDLVHKMQTSRLKSKNIVIQTNHEMALSPSLRNQVQWLLMAQVERELDYIQINCSLNIRDTFYEIDSIPIIVDFKNSTIKLTKRDISIYLQEKDNAQYPSIQEAFKERRELAKELTKKQQKMQMRTEIYSIMLDKSIPIDDRIIKLFDLGVTRRKIASICQSNGYDYINQKYLNELFMKMDIDESNQMEVDSKIQEIEEKILTVNQEKEEIQPRIIKKESFIKKVKKLLKKN